MKTVNNFDCWASTVSPRWMRRVHPCLEEKRGDFFFSFGVSGTLAKTCWKPLFFYHVQQNQAKSAEKRGKTFCTSVIVKRKNESIGQRFPLCHLRHVRQYVQGHTRWEEPKAGAVRTAQRLVLAQQSCCFDALGAERAECNFSAPLWSTACWGGYGTEQISVGPAKEAGLWVEKQTCKISFWVFLIFYHRRYFNTGQRSGGFPTTSTYMTHWMQ